MVALAVICSGTAWAVLPVGRGVRRPRRPRRRAALVLEVVPAQSAALDYTARLAAARRGSPALREGGYRNVLLTNLQIIFERRTEEERVLVAVNADSQPYTAHFDAGCGLAWDLISGQQHDFGGGSQLPPYSAFFWKMER